MKKGYNSVLKLLAVLMFAVIPLIFTGQEVVEEEEEVSKEEVKAANRAAFSKYFYIGGSIGGVAFHGDVYAEPVLPQWKHFNWGFGAIGGWQFHPVLGVRGNFGYVNLTGERYGDVDRAFKGDAFDYSVNATISLINLIFGYNPDRWFDMTAWAGIGQAQYRTRLREHSTATPLGSRGWKEDEPFDNGDNDGINGRDLVTLYPVGIDFDFALGESFLLNINSSLKFTDSDGVDNFSHAAAAVKKDFWHYSGIGLTYKFGQGGVKNMVKDFEDITWKSTPNPLEAHGDYVEVTIEGNFPPKYFQKDAAMYVTPVLRYEGGAVAYEPFTVKGEEVSGDGMVVNYKNGGTITFTGKIPYSPDMDVSELFLVPIIYPAKEGTLATEEEILNSNKYYIVPDVKVNDGVIHTSKYILNNHIPLIAYHDYQKETIISNKAKIFFLINRYDLNWRVPLNKLDENKQKLADLNEFLALGWKVKNIGITGWASPEGEELFNRDLSENRANTAFNYMVMEIKKVARQKESRLNVKDPKAELQWDITWQGPDWDGFMTAVENSALTDKRAILNVIRSADQTRREEEIRNMILIYPEIEENLLPPLRRAIITVNSYEPKRSDEQIMAYGLSYPDSLKVNEIMYAATFYDNNNDQLAIYRNTINVYPNCFRAYNNAGEVLIRMEEYEEAETMLNKAVELNPEFGPAHNNLGVLACHLGEYDKAEAHFQEAQKKGENVDFNLGVLAILDGDYAKAQSMTSGKECNHNTGLIQLLNKDYKAAQKTFECAPPDALTYYLLAITGARQDDTRVLFDNLMKAVEMDPELKDEARYDREFLKYNEMPEFLAIVQ